ncbi:unnamed protein product [Urochloa decumbens]|uniref:Uncharacterized protein n=1 Tax=Urochloa decumbens TaxID=240449 RepID=A0ABC8YY29_9POAL
MDGEGTGDDGLTPLFPPAGGASSHGFNLFSQVDSTGGVQAARTGMESVDLNSQLDGFPHLDHYESFLRGSALPAGSGMERGLAPSRYNRTLGVHRRDAGWSQRGGGGGGGGRGRQLDFGDCAGSMASAPPGGAFIGASSSGAAGARAIAPSGIGRGQRRGTSAYSARGGASTYSARGGASTSSRGRSSRGGGRGRGQGMPRADFYNLEEEDEATQNAIEYQPSSRGNSNKPWLKKLKNGDPPFLAELHEMFHREVVDGSNSYVPGQDHGEGGQQEEEEEEEEEEEFHHSPMSTSSRKSKRSSGSTTSTGHSPEKKNKPQGSKVKNPIVKVLNKIASTFSQSVSTNEKTIQEHKDSKLQAEMKMDGEIERCQQLAWECVAHDSIEAYATSKIFKSKFNRRYFLTIPTAEGRINFLQRWCKENNMY